MSYSERDSKVVFWLRRHLSIYIQLPLLISAPLVAQEFQVISGSATSTTSGSQTIIENTPQAILHWDQFSIASHEKIHFAQLNSTSRVLNRVTGKEMSTLLGALTSNGQVYLINPQGILIGPNATIQTAGFLASTADLSDIDFIQGKEIHFPRFGEGKILNEGKIDCGEGAIFLLAKEVSNTGTCSAELIGIGSGKEVWIQPNSAERIFIRTEPSESGEISNTGILQAFAIELNSGSVYEKAIRLEGEATLLSLNEKGGKLILSASQGTIEIAGQITAPSGNVEVQGKEVAIESTASIDTSGSIGGNITIDSADNLFVERGALLAADGSDGDGGKIVVFANQTTLFEGDLTARALGERGKGGFAEISALGGVRVDSHPDLTARSGQDGHLLIDPGSVTIQVGPNTAPPATLDLFNDGWINAQLALSSLTIDTTNSTNGGTENMQVVSGVTLAWSSNNTLSLLAGANFTLFTGSTTVTNTAGGSIFIQANTGGNIIGGTTFSFVDGNITLIGTNTQGTGAIGIHLFGPTITISGKGTLSMIGTGEGGINFGNGTILTTHDGDLYLNGINTGAGFDGIRPNISTLTCTGNGNLTLIGTSGPGVPSNSGLNFYNTVLSVQNGSINLNGTTQIGDYGILGHPQISSSGSGTIALSGTTYAPATLPVAYGVNLSATTSISSAASGAIAIQGSSPGNTGLLLQGFGASSVLIQAVDGDIAIQGTGSTGIAINQNGNILTTGKGSIALETLKGGDLLIGPQASVTAQGTGKVAIASSRDLLLIGGTFSNASALVSHTTGTATFSAARDLTLTGGTASGCAAAIQPIGADANIQILSVGRNLTLTGGTATGAQAQIGSLLTNATGEILLPSIWGTTLLNGFDTSSYAAIGHGTPTNSLSSLGGQILLLSFGDVILQGASGGSGMLGFAQVGHIDQIGTSSTLNGNIRVSAAGSFAVLGGSQTTGFAQIGHGGQSGTTQVGSCNMLVQAGFNGTILSSAGQARIVNPSTVLGSGNLTIVVDNFYPNPPQAGFGSFRLASTLSATGQLRIYTSTQAFNQIVPGTLINGAPFYPGPLYRNSETEEWGIWAYGGSYGATPFRFYYKDDFFGIPPALVIANMGSLADLFPVIPTWQFNTQFLNACGIWKDKPFYCKEQYSPLLVVNWIEEANDLEYEMRSIAQDLTPVSERLERDTTDREIPSRSESSIPSQAGASKGNSGPAAQRGSLRGTPRSRDLSPQDKR